MEYLHFKGYNLTVQKTSRRRPDLAACGGNEAESYAHFGIEQVRTLQIKKEDIENIFIYEPYSQFEKTVSAKGIIETQLGQKLSWRVVCALTNGDYVELQVVSEVPVNAISGKYQGSPDKSDGLVFLETPAGFNALATPFQAWTTKNNSGVGINTIPETVEDGPNYMINQRLVGLPGFEGEMPAIEGKVYDWSAEAIAAYFGVFDNGQIDTGFGSSVSAVDVKRLVGEWLVDMVSKYLVSSPGRPVTEVTLAEVPDFTYNNGKETITYGGFKLKFGALGCPSIGWQQNCDGATLDENYAFAYLLEGLNNLPAGQNGLALGVYSVPFRYSANYVPFGIETPPVAEGEGAPPAEAMA